MTLTEHPGSGWMVNPRTGEVFGLVKRWSGRPLGRVGTHGYVGIAGKYLAHRLIWEACVGPIPDRMVVNHKNGIKTDNRLVNLEVITSAENNIHALAHGFRRPPQTFGARNPNYKVTPQMHAEILQRLAAGETGVSIAGDLGLSPKTVSRVKRGERCPS